MTIEGDTSTDGLPAPSLWQRTGRVDIRSRSTLGATDYRLMSRRP